MLWIKDESLNKRARFKKFIVRAKIKIEINKKIKIKTKAKYFFFYFLNFIFEDFFLLMNKILKINSYLMLFWG
jgi:hypothetical protein